MFLLLIPSFAFEGGWPPKVAGWMVTRKKVTFSRTHWQEIVGNTKIRTIQYSTVSQEGILVSYTTQFVQKRSTVPELYKTRQTLQIYTAQQLKNLLHKNGFRVLNKMADAIPFF